MAFQVECRQVGEVTVVELSGRMDGTPETATVHDTIRALVERGRRALVLDMGGVPWANSLGIGVLISSAATVRRAGGTLALCSVGDRLRKALTICGVVPGVLDVYEDADAAVETLA